jgi:hypothetical protein
MNFRIDPLTKNGNFDVDFFSSKEYKEEGQILNDYLIDEGFEQVKEKFFIDFKDRRWEITPVAKKNKRKKDK